MVEQMCVQKIKNTYFYYYDKEDPVIGTLKRGQLFGEGNFNLLNLFIRENKGGTILDCGAHIGTFTLPAALHEDGKYNIIALEGGSTNVECLNKTFGSFKNVKVIESILSNKVGKCSFKDDGPFGYMVEDDNGSLNSTTIDDIVKNNIVDENIVGIKLDIEGGEELGMQGAAYTLSKYKPPILMEINGHCLRLAGKKPASILNEIEKHNYSSFFIIENRLFIINPNNLFPFCVTDIICLHNDYISFDKNELTIDSLKRVAHSNFQNSNEDCKNYFKSVGVY